MNATNLTYKQNTVVNAVLTLIDSMDDNMRAVLWTKVREGRSRAVSQEKKVTRHVWDNKPISPEIMSLTFKQRKPLDNYDDMLESALKKKYQ